MILYTIGFTKKTAKEFFETLRDSGAKRVVDVRLSNSSQLAGFAKRPDIEYFLEAISGIGYVHEPLLAPTQEMFDAYKKSGGSWDALEGRFLELMRTRKIEATVSKEIISDGCLLCSEDKPHHCHRRLVAEYLRDHWGDIEIKHLG